VFLSGDAGDPGVPGRPGSVIGISALVGLPGLPGRPGDIGDPGRPGVDAPDGGKGMYLGTASSLVLLFVIFKQDCISVKNRPPTCIYLVCSHHALTKH